MRFWTCLLAPFVLGACELLPVYNEWEAQPANPPLPATFVEVDSQALTAVCKDPPVSYLHGCAVRDFGKRACIVYTRAAPPQWLVDHERRHCNGWDHPRGFPSAPGFPT